MREITKQTLEEIKKRFKTDIGYVGNWDGDNSMYCPQVNGLVNICFNRLGFNILSIENSQFFLESTTFDKKRGLFYSAVNLESKIIAPYFNAGKNAIFALGLALNGLIDQAEDILKKLRESPLYLKEEGLYAREINLDTGEVNPLLITQSNLWIALAYSSIGQNGEATKIMRSLEKVKYDQDCGLFNSQDARNRMSKKRFFADDQALGILVYNQIGEKQKARDLTEAVLNSSLYDRQSGLFNSSFSSDDIDTTKSTYKNSLMAQALGKLGHSEELAKVKKGLVRELYDSEERLFNQTTKDKTKVPDNSALALVTLEL